MNDKLSQMIAEKGFVLADGATGTSLFNFGRPFFSAFFLNRENLVLDINPMGRSIMLNTDPRGGHALANPRTRCCAPATF